MLLTKRQGIHRCPRASASCRPKAAAGLRHSRRPAALTVSHQLSGRSQHRILRLVATLVASTLLLISSVEAQAQAQDLTLSSSSSSSTDCASCEASVDTMLSSLYTWVWGGESEYCKRDFPEVWAGFVDTFSDTLNARGATVKPLGSQASPPATVLPAVPRLVAIGDLHGDMGKAKRAFQLGGLIDAQDRWSGGTTTAVQVGDQLDRGDNEVEILYWLERLQKEARQAGGALHVLNGNHETMNAAGRFRYATRGGIDGFRRWQLVELMASKLKAQCGCTPEVGTAPAMGPDSEAGPQARWSALQPGGPLARRFLAPHPVVLQVGSTLFVHGGVLPEHAQYGLERLNAETAAWLQGRSPTMPEFLGGRSAVVWAREYSTEADVRKGWLQGRSPTMPEFLGGRSAVLRAREHCTEEAAQCDCTALDKALGMVGGAQRMVVGHTIQPNGITTACDQRVYRIDVGLSHGCGNGPTQVLEVLNDKDVRLLSEGAAPMSYPQRVQAKAGEADLKQARWQWPGAQQDSRVPQGSAA